jgi:4-phospho-D-threonate 3-dehydrogenase / 4-phospho-D-erythronate 3-dehydrogenase
MSRLALTIGDPAGVGPEIILKAAARLRARDDLQLVAVAPRQCLADAARAIGGDIERAWAAGAAALGLRVEEIPAPDAPIVVGRVSAAAGAVAYTSIARAVELTMNGGADAIVTAPISKEALNLAGYPFSGHTELLAHLSGGSQPVMMLAHGAMRVSHMTTHIPLRDVPPRITRERMLRVLDVTQDALRRIGIEHPRIAIAALNPHAGEGGMLGYEDLEVTAPLVAALCAQGWKLDGPVPGDTVFVKLRAGRYDAVVAMYHDQGHIPVKLLGFEVDPVTGSWIALNGVNITLGLPVIRTSVDHGTAFDIAGRNIASEQSLIDAIEYAHALVRNVPARAA